MAVLDRLRGAATGGAIEAATPPVPVNVKPIPVPDDVKKRIARAKEGMKSVAARRKLAVEFARNNHFSSIDKDETKINHLSTVDKIFGGEKPTHRVRRSHDILAPVLKAKISAATQRIPGYEVLAATNDPEDYSAARVGEKALVSGYEVWGVRRAFRRAIWHALVTEEAFLMPIFDETRGPFSEETAMDPETGEPVFDENEAPVTKVVGAGEISYSVFGGLEVGHEHGVQFEDSRFYVIVTARPREQVEAEPGFLGPKLTADAQGSPDFLGYVPKGADLVLQTDYLERPCVAEPNGRRVIEANGRQIFDVEDYPLFDHTGEVVDEPCLRRISYAIDGQADHDRGLVGSVIETLRDFDFASNKAVEYLQLVLLPQMIGPEGAMKTDPTDTPGAYVEIDEDAWARGMKPEWRQMPSMPGEFGVERDRAQALLGSIASENAVPSEVESAKAISALATKDALAWQDFMEDVAACFAATARDSLCLVQIYYDDERMARLRGRTGWECIPEFRGSDIRGQVDVRVSVGSLEPLTRAVSEQRILNMARLFPEYFQPELVLAALKSGDPDRLNEGFEEDEAQANYLINQLRAGTFWQLPPRPPFPGEAAPQLDPSSGQPMVGPDGQPVMLTEIPGWMPRPFDNVVVFKRAFEKFMKTDEWRHLDPAVQQATSYVYSGLLELEARRNAERVAAQTATAERLGTQNAALPPGPKQLPSLPSPAAAGAEAPGAE